MLQRAANNAYSWWWASHIRTKQSKWLEHNLQDMEDKVSNMLKIIDEDGDSFAKRAEMYFRKRPELINFVEESYRAYRALAERYDHISREMQNANRTIATVFPEQVQFAMDDEEEENFPGELNPSLDPPGKPPKGFPPISKPIVPKIPKVPMKELKAHPTFISRKKHLRRTTSSARATTTSSGLRKADALEEIDKLQKGILGLQTEKEFVKSSYENGLSNYWEIENQITEMQGRVCNLQDEFGVGSVIDDDEARKLMATSALNSCQRALIQLQEKQEQSAEEARIEHQRIKEAHEKLDTLRNEFLEKQTDRRKLPQEHESANAGSEAKHLEHLVDSLERERHDMESIREKIRETLEVNSNTSLTATELAEKIDELADKVITLETAVSSQNALVARLRSETDELQAHIRSLEEDKETLLDGSDNMSSKLREMEDELHRVQNLNKSIEDQNHHLQTHFTEATCNIDHLSEKLQNIKPDEEDQNTGLFQELKSVPEAKSGKEFEEREDLPPPGSGSDVSKDVETEIEGVENEVRGNFSNCIKAEGRNEEESKVKSNLSNKVEVLSARDKEAEQQNKNEKPELSEGQPQFEQSDLPQLGSGLDVSEDVETEIEKRRDEVWENFSNWDKAEGGGGGGEEEESIVKSNLSNRVEVLSEQDKEAERQNKDEKQELSEGPPQLEQSDLPHLGSGSEVSKDVETGIEKGEDHWETFFSDLVKAEGAEESIVQSNLSNKIEVLSEQDKESEQQNKDEKQDLLETVDNDPDNESRELGTEEEEEPNWRKLFLNGIDDREKILLEEYTSILRNFKEVKKKLSEVEKKNRDSLFDSTMQIKELKNANTLKDEEIQSLRKKLNPQHLNPFLETISTEYNPSNQGWPHESVTKEDSPRFSSISSLNSNRQPLYVFLDDKYFDAAVRNEELTAQRFPSSPTEHCPVSTIEEKIRTDIDDLLEENLEFWLKFSTSFHQIQKFETSIQDLQAELSNLKEKQEGSAKNQSLKSDARPIYKHLGEIQTELKLWFEHNALLKDELRSRLSSLCDIQEELSRLSNAGSGAEMINLSHYQGAKFQGEVQNMKQENNKVAHELQAGLNRVNGLQVEIERALSTMDDDFGFSESKNQAKPSLSSRSRIPLRSFLFGVKLMKQKPSIFSCMNPSLQRQYSDLASGVRP